MMRLVFVSLLASALTSCNTHRSKGRGFEGAACTEDATCMETMRCLKGSCVTREAFDAELRCQKSKACSAEGECSGAITGYKLFEAADRGCLPDEDAHCAHAEVCATEGNCALFGESVLRRCAPSTDAHCEASRACAERDACWLVRDPFGPRCDRAYPPEANLAERLALPKEVASADACSVSPAVWSVGEKPDDKPKVGLYCQVEKKDDFDGMTVAIDRRASMQLTSNDDQRAYAFALPLVVADGQRVSFYLTDNEMIDRHPPRFVALTMNGDQASAVGDGVTARCVRTSQDQAEKLAKPWLTETDLYLRYARSERLPTQKSWGMRHDLQYAVRLLVRASCILGWKDPAIVERRDAAAALEKRWNAALAKIDKPPVSLLPQ